MDKKTANAIGKECEKALQAVAEKFGLELQYRGGRFSDTDYTPKFVFQGKNEKGENKLESDWNKYAELYDLKKDWLGEIIPLNGQDGIILGLEGKNHKYPVIVEGSNGTQYKLSVDQVKVRIARRSNG